MGLFKSRDERRIEREMELRKGIQRMKKHIVDLTKSEEDWLSKAKRAKQIKDKDALEVIRKQLKQVVGMRRSIERQLLMLEVVKQIKDQAETQVSFAESLQSVSAAIASAYGSINLEQTQSNFERAMSQAHSMSQRMDLLLDMSKDSMFMGEGSGEVVVTDAEIDKMLGADPQEERRKSREQLDQEIAAELGSLPESAEKEKPGT